MLLGIVGLALTLVSVAARFVGAIDESTLKRLMLAGTLLWFASAIWRERLSKSK